MTAGMVSSGCRGTSRITPMMMIMVVIMEEAAMAMLAMTSPSSVPWLTSAWVMAFMAQGSFRLVTLPVRNAM